MNIGNTFNDDRNYVGVAKKISKNGDVEKYLIKLEMFSTRNSDMLIIFKLKPNEANSDESLFDTKLTKEKIEEIDKLITESDSGDNTIKIISRNNSTGKITIQGE